MPRSRACKVSYVDLYQCHRYDDRHPARGDACDALTRAVRAGKTRYIGFSEWPVDRIEAALAMPGVEKFVSSQPQYSLLHRDPERALLPLCARSGISQIVWSPLAQGVLTGKYQPGAPLPTDSRAADRLDEGLPESGRGSNPKMLQAIQALRAARVRGRASRSRSSRSPGCCVNQTWRPPSSAPPGPTRSMRMSLPADRRCRPSSSRSAEKRSSAPHLSFA